MLDHAVGLAARAASGLLVRCAVPSASTAPCARGTHANMAISITSGADGATRLPKVSSNAPSLPSRYLWKFHLGVAASPT